MRVSDDLTNKSGRPVFSLDAWSLNNVTMSSRKWLSRTLCVETVSYKVTKGALNRMRSDGTDFMAKRFFRYWLALLLIPSLSVVGQNPATSAGSWSGVIVSSACNADEAFNESPECGKNVPGAKLSLYDDTNRVMYGLEPQKSIKAHLGEAVTIQGTLDGDSIQVASIDLMSIGLSVGHNAPAFSVRDQFGRVQTLDTLKGTNGTVLLFFRSADW
jgi:hypothetical protein